MDLERTERSTGKARVIEPTPAGTDLLERCRALLAELSAFARFAAERKCKSVDIRRFSSSVQAEEKSLLKLAEADQTAIDTVHNLRSSNLPFYEAVWHSAKASSRLLGLQKRFYWNGPSQEARKGKQKKRSALVDVVADGGLRWIKVSTVSESKLLFEKAKAGWEADEWNESSSDDMVGRKVLADGAEPAIKPDDDDSEDENNGQVELVRVAHDLNKAALATRVHFKHPTTTILLPSLQEGANEVVDGILGEIRAAGVTVQCGKSLLEADPQYDAGPASESFEHMLPLFRPAVTQTINLDCTVLLALISDLSHGNVNEIVLPGKPHPSLTYQVESERATPLLPTVLYPGLKGVDKLVTSARSATRMWDIVRTIGTSAEHERARLLFGNSGDAETDLNGSTQQDPTYLRTRLGELSIHGLPSMPLPIIVVEDGIRTVSSIPSRIIGRVAGQLSDINRSVFLLGWTNGWTTVTSNQTAVKIIETTVTDELDRIQASSDIADLEFEGPLIWTIDVARSLVGKESGRAQ